MKKNKSIYNSNEIAKYIEENQTEIDNNNFFYYRGKNHIFRRNIYKIRKKI